MLTLLLAMVGCAESEPGLRIADGERTIVVRDGVIAAIEGPGEADVTGDLVTAGFVDAHAHPAGLGRMRALLDLTGATTYREVLDRVRSASGSGWVEGRGWDQNDWTDHADWPTARDLDTIVPDRPVALRRVDGHALWVNSAALAAAGIGKDTPDPEGGRILRHPDGTPRGVLVDTAMDLVRSPDPGEAEKERRLRVVASMQPTHATSDMAWAEARLGPERVRWAYAWRSVLDAGVPLAFGSDFPVEGVAPSLGLWSATRRAGLDGEPENGWYPDQGLTEDEAVSAFTRGSAFAAHEEARLGTIEVGRTADLTIWRIDAGATPPWRPVATVVGGELVWRLP